MCSASSAAIRSGAGAQPITWVSLAGELQRDWARSNTVQGLVDLVINERLAKK
jgi:hypothetical protein